MLLITTQELVHCFSVSERGFEVQITDVSILFTGVSFR